VIAIAELLPRNGKATFLTVRFSDLSVTRISQKTGNDRLDI
jgi:hypothetical protein